MHDVDDRTINTDCRKVLVWDGVNIKPYEQEIKLQGSREVSGR